MNAVVALVAFFGAAAYFIGQRRGGRPWVYVAVSVPLAIAVYFAVVIAAAVIAT
jgi:hypothetical protein